MSHYTSVVPLWPINEHLRINLFAMDNVLHDSLLLHTCPSVWLIPVFPSGLRYVSFSQRLWAAAAQSVKPDPITTAVSTGRLPADTHTGPLSLTSSRITILCLCWTKKNHTWANSQQLNQKCWETWTSWWFLGTGTREDDELMCNGCMSHCINVIIYSYRLMLTAFPRGPFSLCAFKCVRNTFCMTASHFWRDCATGLLNTLPLVCMPSRYCTFWHVNEAQTFCTPERQVGAFHSSDRWRPETINGETPLDVSSVSFNPFTAMRTHTHR